MAKTAKLPLIEEIKFEMWDDVIKRLDKSKNEATFVVKLQQYGTTADGYPLHCLCKKRQCPVYVFKAILSAMPKAIQVSLQPFDILPIHLACIHGASLDIIKLLVDTYPESVNVQDMEGNLAIHHACFLGDTIVVDYLCRISPNSLYSINKKLQNPLHLACSRLDTSHNLIALLLRYCPLLNHLL